jgi:hypothetical protein
MSLTILDIAHHRNGIAGAPFHAILFCDDEDPDAGAVKLGIVFNAPWHTAVFDIGKLSEWFIGFGLNSWRGDRYEPHLRRAINSPAEVDHE